LTDIHDIESSAPAVQAARADDAPEQDAGAAVVTNVPVAACGAARAA
jgi:hypothetical protein